jgi:dynein heavy chain, axonemal
MLQNGFPDSIVNFKDDIISATIDVYNTAVGALLPTPTKAHYLFNLRDVSRVVGGLLMMRKDAVADIKTPKVKYVRLWVHEVLRVFCDRSVSLLLLFWWMP